MRDNMYNVHGCLLMSKKNYAMTYFALVTLLESSFLRHVFFICLFIDQTTPVNIYGGVRLVNLGDYYLCWLLISYVHGNTNTFVS